MKTGFFLKLTKLELAVLDNEGEVEISERYIAG